MKTLKFRDYLVPLVLSGEKDSTWRLFDEKDIKEGDELNLINWNTGEEFTKVTVIETKEKMLKEIEEGDFDGHERFESEEKMYEEYKKYYGDKVTPESIIKMIKFELK
jgi:hypothetical protein